MKHLLSLIFLCFILIACSEPSVYIINGEVSSKKEVERLDLSEIFTYQKWDPKQQGSCFPEIERKVTVPVVAITTKKFEDEKQRQRHALLNIILNLPLADNEILIVIDGIIFPASELQELRKMSSDQLKETFVLLKEDAEVHYGSYAKQITLVINTYQPEHWNLTAH